jgi:hypothetical protein
VQGICGGSEHSCRDATDEKYMVPSNVPSWSHADDLTKTHHLSARARRTRPTAPSCDVVVSPCLLPCAESSPPGPPIQYMSFSLGGLPIYTSPAYRLVFVHYYVLNEDLRVTWVTNQRIVPVLIDRSNQVLYPVARRIFQQTRWYDLSASDHQQEHMSADWSQQRQSSKRAARG